MEAAALPTGFVTLLMSDIEGTTVLLRKLGDRYGALLNDVRGILRAAVSGSGGREIDARADEFFAVFQRAGAAVEAAVAVQRALAAREWTDGLEVRLRIGIHSGCSWGAPQVPGRAVTSRRPLSRLCSQLMLRSTPS